MKHLLFIKEFCPYCQKVMKHIEEKNIDCKFLDVTDPVNLDELIILGGKEQVPFFVDTENNVKMYESDEIIKYLDTL